MTHFSVDSDQVSLANQNIQSTIARVASEHDTLHSQLAALQNSWTGVASSSFQELAMRWRQTSSAVETQLAEIGQALQQAANLYSEIELANQRLFL